MNEPLLNFVIVDNNDTVQVKVEMLGDSIMMPKNEIRGVGQVVMIQDTEGYVIGFWKPVRKEDGTVPVRSPYPGHSSIRRVPSSSQARRGTPLPSALPTEGTSCDPVSQQEEEYPYSRISKKA